MELVTCLQETMASLHFRREHVLSLASSKSKSMAMSLSPAQWMVNKTQRWMNYADFYRHIPTLSVHTINRVRDNALDYVKSLHIDDGSYRKYRYAYGREASLLYASVFAALLRHLLGDLHQLTPKQQSQWVDHIRSYQCTDGLFRDPLVVNDIAETEDWWGWRHLTLLTLMALHALGSRPKYQLSFLERVNTPS